MRVSISITQKTKNLLEELSHSHRLDISKTITKLIEEAYREKLEIQKIIIENKKKE